MKIALLIYAVGFCVGMLVNELLLYLKKCSGVLRIDCSNPEKDSYRFEIDNLDELHKKHFVILKVDPNADLSQK